MPRPTPQTFARRLGLQAIMWGLFVAAMLGAWQLSRVRDRGLVIPPLAPAKRFGDLLVALPTGWDIRVDPAAAQLLAIEPPSSRLHRVVILTEQLLAGPPPAEFIADQLHKAPRITPIDFTGLGAKGELAQNMLQEENTGEIFQEFDAFVFLPDSNLAVTVAFRGVPGFGRIDQQNFQTIIDHLQLVPNPRPKPIVQPNAGPLVPIGRWHRLTQPAGR